MNAFTQPMSIPKTVQIYSSLRECLEACLGELDTYWTYYDTSGRKRRILMETAIKNIRKTGCWGWLEKKKIVHLWFRKNCRKEELVHLLGHEFGHAQGKHLWYGKEEVKAGTYGHVAIEAYRLATKLKGMK